MNSFFSHKPANNNFANLQNQTNNMPYPMKNGKPITGITSETLAWYRANNMLLDPKFDRLAKIGDKLKEKEEEKIRTLSIKFVSCNVDDNNFNLTFEITAKNLKTNKAKIYVQEMNATNEDAVPLTSVTILPNGKKNITVSFDKNKEFNSYLWQSGHVYQATIICDEIPAETPEFEIKCSKKVEKKKNTCYCNRDFTVEELKNIVVKLRENTFYNKQTIYSYHGEKLFYRNDKTKNDYITEIVDKEDRTFEKLTFVLNKSFKEYRINTCIRKISFLAQMYIETNFFTATIELTHKEMPYEPYRGRGFIQLTGEKDGEPGIQDSRTKNATAYLGYKIYSQIDVVTDPSIISKSLHYSADSAGWFWVYGKMISTGEVINLNEKCGVNETDFKELTRLIKGKATEFTERYDTFKELLKIMNHEKCTNK